jgi:hypothetical protein
VARIPIFDSEATVDSAGNAINQSLVLATARRSMPVRLFGAADGMIQQVSFEFILNGAAGNLTLQWYLEYFGDTPTVNSFPSNRVFPGADPAWPWSREQSAESSGSGGINHYNVTRTIQSFNAAGAADSRWFPMNVHALWCRLAVTPTAGILTPAQRLRIFAHCGGYGSEEALEALTVPYGYNFR